MAKVTYIDREGLALTKEAWQAKKADASYTTVRLYDNGVVNIQLIWVGRLVDAHETFPDYWKNFVLLVKNYKADGTLVSDPVDNDKPFANERAAVEAYEEFLLKWTQSGLDEEGEFIEADNSLTPPAPPDPNKPATSSEELGNVGAW